MLRLKIAALALCTATMIAIPTAQDAAIAAKKEREPAVIPAPPEGKGQVVFYRTGGFVGAAIACNVRENDVLVGKLSGGKYFVHVAEPGKHAFTAKSEAKDTLNMEVESDETYYVRCKIGAGFMAGRPNLSPVQKADFDKKSAKLKFKDQEKIDKEVAKDTAKRSK